MSAAAVMVRDRAATAIDFVGQIVTKRLLVHDHQTDMEWHRCFVCCARPG